MNACLVTVEGDYFALAEAGGRKKVKRRYKIQVKVATPEGALSVIKNKILDRALTKKYEDYHTYHTHEITNLTDLQGQPLMGYTNVRIMNFNQIADYVRANRLPIKLELYTELDTLRTMVFLAETNPTEFARKQVTLEKEASENALLAELNPDLFDVHKPIKIPDVSEIPEIEPSKKVTDQKKQMTWDDAQKKYVPVEEYVEDFNRPDEAPYADNVDDELGLEHEPKVSANQTTTITQNRNLIDEL